MRQQQQGGTQGLPVGNVLTRMATFWPLEVSLGLHHLVFRWPFNYIINTCSYFCLNCTDEWSCFVYLIWATFDLLTNVGLIWPVFNITLALKMISNQRVKSMHSQQFHVHTPLLMGTFRISCELRRRVLCALCYLQLPNWFIWVWNRSSAVCEVWLIGKIER